MTTTLLAMLRTSMGRHRAALCGALVSMLAGSASAQLVDISTGPLFGSRQAHPNVVVTTSVEFPTVGAAYKDIAYVPANTYLGYFDATKCYQYQNSPSPGYFYVSAAVSNASHECISMSNSFSGNFM